MLSTNYATSKTSVLYDDDTMIDKDLNLTAILDGATVYADADFVIIAAFANYGFIKNYFYISYVEEGINLVLKVNLNVVMVIKNAILVGYTCSLYVKDKQGAKNFNLLLIN